MANEVVKFGNQVNKVPFRNFNKRNYNIFFSIVSRMRDRGTDEVTFSYKQLISLSGIKRYNAHPADFSRDLYSTYHKMLGLTICRNSKDRYDEWVLFTDFHIDRKKRTCTISVNPNLKGILNNLVSQFTRFSLAEFNNLNSTYSKSLFRLLKQYRTTGRLYLSMHKFRYLLCVPKSYHLSNIDNRIINPSIIELSGVFPDLHITSVKHGRRVVGFRFNFRKELHKEDDFNKYGMNGMNWQLKNIVHNPYLSKSKKREAENKVIDNPIGIAYRTTPMQKFNKELKRDTLPQLKNVWEMYKTHHRYLTEYQSKKLHKFIKKREAYQEKHDTRDITI